MEAQWPIIALTAALVLVTSYYAWQNRQMVIEMRRARDLATETREAEEHRERLRDLRDVTDDAAIALNDLWVILGSFLYAVPRGDPPVSRRSPTEARDPDPRAFVEAFERLRHAHLRLLNRVEWGDTFHSPVGRAVSDVQAAYNAILHEDPLAPRDPKSDGAIGKANGSVQHGLRELQETCRQRFAPLGLPDSRYAAVMVLNIKKRVEQTEKLLAALRLDKRRHAKVTGPDKDGRVVVRDDEARQGEARERLVQSLDAADPGWRTWFELQPPHESESATWAKRLRQRVVVVVGKWDQSVMSSCQLHLLTEVDRRELSSHLTEPTD